MNAPTSRLTPSLAGRKGRRGVRTNWLVKHYRHINSYLTKEEAALLQSLHAEHPERKVKDVYREMVVNLDRRTRGEETRTLEETDRQLERALARVAELEKERDDRTYRANDKSNMDRTTAEKAARYAPLRKDAAKWASQLEGIVELLKGAAQCDPEASETNVHKVASAVVALLEPISDQMNDGSE